MEQLKDIPKLAIGWLLGKLIPLPDFDAIDAHLQEIAAATAQSEDNG